MINSKDYEDMWDLADELAEKEREEQHQGNKFKLDRRDIHLKRMTEKAPERIEPQKETLRRRL
ncbi:MAG: hypothetical protein M1416_02965 [Candidatus Pacearchaeota archaeon]|nr:hypothetical protein [Candidatus Pacearchaeota archaeon]